LFGGTNNEKNIDTFIPKSESDFNEYAELIAHRLRAFEVKHFISDISF
jgi:translation initiation factor 3 subunit J